MNHILNLLDWCLKRFLQSLLVLITTVVCWQVFSRYILSSPSSFTEELARFLLIWLTLLGAAYAYRHKVHLGLDMIYSQANQTQQKIMYCIIHFSVGAFALCVMLIGGWSLVNMTSKLGQSSPVMGIDISFVYMVVPLSGLLILIYAIHALLNLPSKSE
jgi:TRAP-type C4-dicarboxylate transport system permease small subunit